MIRMPTSVILGMILVFFSPLSRADESTVHCSHPKVCQVIEVMAPDLNVKIDASLEKLEGDPHHVQVTLGQMKELIRAKVLITPSPELQSWLPKVLKSRNSDKTFSLKINEKKKSLTPKDRRILAHFWLYPRQICHNLPELAKFLKNNFHEVSLSGKQGLLKTCNRFVKKVHTVLHHYTKSQDSPPIILTHDALSLLFAKYEIKSLSLSGSGHGENFGTRELKELKQLIKSSPDSPLIWVLEKGLHSTSKVKRMTRPIDKVITINTSGYGQKSRDIFAPLRELINFLKEFNEQGKKR